MKIISQKTSLHTIWDNRETPFEDMLKIVIDIDREIIAVDAELHADLERLLLDNGSDQKNLWGANIFPERSRDKLIEYTALINIRPARENRSMEIKSDMIRQKIRNITFNLLI